MAIPAPKTMIKIIWLIHFTLTTWAVMSAYLAGVTSYILTQLGVLAFGFWAIVATENADALSMFFVTLCISVVNDIILMSIYEPRAHDAFEKPDGIPAGYVNEYRWALGMSIVNIILKPISIVLVFSMYRSASNGTDFQFNIPGIHGGGTTSSGRSNHTPYNPIETAQDSYPGVYTQPQYQYQSAPPSQPEGTPPSYSKNNPHNNNQQPKA